VILQKLSPEQSFAVAMAVDALKKFRVFLLADGSGMGKTWEAIATAAIAVEQGQTVLMVATRRALRANFQYGPRTIGGAYREAFDGLGLTPIILTPSQAKRQEARGPGIFVTSYECLPFVDYDRKNTLLVLDECQALKNVTSQPGGFGAMRIGDVERVLYMTATPLDKVRQLRYMARLFAPGLTKAVDPTTGEQVGERRDDSRTLEQLLRNLGAHEHGGRLVLQPGVTREEFRRRLETVFKALAMENRVVRRELRLMA
jgi:hypothetical protein